MKIALISDATRIIGLEQGYLGLPLRDERLYCDGEHDTPCMVSAWLPSAEELDRLNKGEAIHLRVLGTGHPPVMMEVGPAMPYPPAVTL